MTGIKGMKGSGGAREGAGRKPKEVKTTTIAFRVPETETSEAKLMKLAKKAIQNYLSKKTP